MNCDQYFSISVFEAPGFIPKISNTRGLFTPCCTFYRLTSQTVYCELPQNIINAIKEVISIFNQTRIIKKYGTPAIALFILPFLPAFSRQQQNFIVAIWEKLAIKFTTPLKICSNIRTESAQNLLFLCPRGSVH